jgi:hypothetical protein
MRPARYSSVAVSRRFTSFSANVNVPTLPRRFPSTTLLARSSSAEAAAVVDEDDAADALIFDVAAAEVLGWGLSGTSSSLDSEEVVAGDDGDAADVDVAAAEVAGCGRMSDTSSSSLDCDDDSDDDAGGLSLGDLYHPEKQHQQQKHR